MISTGVDYFCGLNLETHKDPKARKIYVSLSILVNVSLLCVFKYYDFFAVNFQSLMGEFGLTVNPFILDVALPIGISFYTFQTMSYTLDVYRGKVKAARNILDFALYVSYFPQLIAGPIERGTRLLPQLLNPRTITMDNIYRGMYLFFWGLFLKVFIADNLAQIVNPVFLPQESFNGASVVLATYAFSFQIYCDFAGYSFMAIGMSKCMGIELMENFKRPYFAKNISDFWRRWHISLSSWFRDYVFSPFYIYVGKLKILSGLPLARRHDISFFLTLMTTEFMLGLWHGAGWNFGFFGIYHGIVIWAYYYMKKSWDRMNIALQIFLTYQIACLGWLVFRAPTLGQAMDMASSIIFNFDLSPELGLAATALAILGFVSVLITVQVFQDLKNDTFVVFRLPKFLRLIFIVFLACLILVFGDFNDRPFIYFQF